MTAEGEGALEEAKSDTNRRLTMVIQPVACPFQRMNASSLVSTCLEVYCNPQVVGCVIVVGTILLHHAYAR